VSLALFTVGHRVAGGPLCAATKGVLRLSNSKSTCSRRQGRNSSSGLASRSGFGGFPTIFALTAWFLPSPPVHGKAPYAMRLAVGELGRPRSGHPERSGRSALLSNYRAMRLITAPQTKPPRSIRSYLHFVARIFCRPSAAGRQHQRDCHSTHGTNLHLTRFKVLPAPANQTARRDQDAPVRPPCPR
jgi:hypothetical protein